MLVFTCKLNSDRPVNKQNIDGVSASSLYYLSTAVNSDFSKVKVGSSATIYMEIIYFHYNSGHKEPKNQHMYDYFDYGFHASVITHLKRKNSRQEQGNVTSVLSV